MALILALFAGIVIAFALHGAVYPHRLLEMARRFMAGPGVWGAVAIRIVLAVLLWSCAPVSHTPILFRVLAVVALLAAVALPVVGSARLMELIERVAAWPPTAIRLACVLGAAFGAFLLWSVSPALGVASL